MHELSIAREIIAIVDDELARLHLRRVITVNIRLGVMNSVVPEALAFSFEAAVTGTDLDGARLEIKTIPIKGCCRSCRQEFIVKEFQFICPHCGSSRLEVIEGEELEIDHIVGE